MSCQRRANPLAATTARCDPCGTAPTCALTVRRPAAS